MMDRNYLHGEDNADFNIIEIILEDKLRKWQDNYLHHRVIMTEFRLNPKLEIHFWES